MNNSEFIAFIDRASLLFDDVKRFIDSRLKDKQALTEEWFRVMKKIEAQDANAVLDRMLDGSMARVDYFDCGRFPNIVLFEARNIAGARRQHRQQFSDGPRYRCGICLDTGLVNVWNPRFVENYRQEFTKIIRTEIDRNAPAKNPRSISYNLDRFDPLREITAYRYDPPNWQGLAARWWRTNEGQGPIHHQVRCNCDCEASVRLGREYTAFVNGERRRGTSTLGVPACGMATYNPRVMPRKTPDAYHDLFEWYCEHEPLSSLEWQGTPEDYQREFV